MPCPRRGASMDIPDLHSRLAEALCQAESLLQAASDHAQHLRGLQRLSKSGADDERDMAEAGDRRSKVATWPETPGRLSLRSNASEAKTVSLDDLIADQTKDDCRAAQIPSVRIPPPVLLDAWRGDVDNNIVRSSISVATTHMTWKRSAVGGPSRSESHMSLGDSVADEGNCCFAERCVMMPTSRWRVAWDILSLFWISWDLAVLPLAVFNVDDLPVVRLFGLMSTSFWALDVGMHFWCAYHRPDGLVETRMKHIAKHYLRSWFGFDLFVVTFDIVSRLMYIGGGVLGRLGKMWPLTRVLRSLRMIRLARAMKFLVVLDQLTDATLSKPIAAGLSIARLLAEVAFIAHFIACAWYGVGTLEGGGWTRPFQDLPAIYLYLMSFHWTIAQFTPAPSNIHAITGPERVFSTLVLFVGIVVFSSLIGRVTALVTKRHQEATQQMIETEELRNLCIDKHISVALGNQLLRYVNRPSARKTMFVEGDVSCLQRIPVGLIAELRYCLYAKVLVELPLLRLLRDIRRPLMTEVCCCAVKEFRVFRDEPLFEINGIGMTMFFFVRGTFSYHLGCRKADRENGIPLGAGDTLCEIALWTAWEHRGALVPTSIGSAMTLHRDGLREVAQRHTPFLHFLRRYAGHYLERLQVASANCLIDDAWCAFEAREDIAEILLHAPATATSL
mmetsp:Transcript_29020/g.83243  ORF Transcript_29020/g.83243 Transcript_29020/m.83243 type:complete len:674 (-) Transcript_29020:123-2144(-)